jgi:hypothetical protein
MNMGYVHTVSEMFRRAQGIFETHEDLKYYVAQPNYARVSISDFMFKVVSQFTFFHERAHLIQHREESEFLFQDNTIGESETKWDESRHVKEWDADLAAVRQMYFRTLVDYELLEPEYQGKDALFKLICVSISAILLYFFRTHGDDEIYFAKKTHPHPIVRIKYIMHHFSILLRWKRPFGFSYDLGSITNEVYKVCYLIGDIDNHKMKQYFQAHDADIELYIEGLGSAAKKYPKLYFWYMKEQKEKAELGEREQEVQT